jgi:hypothetical protein
MTSEHDAERTPGLTRRTILRRAAAAGAVAWTAPMIVDSLASPAAAASLTGCYRAEFVRTATDGCGTYARATPSNGLGCVPNFWNNLPEYQGELSLSVTSTGACAYEVTISAASGCTIDSRSGARADMSNQCAQGTFVTDPPSGCRKMLFTPGFQPDRFKILISCGGVACAGGAPCAT